MPDSTLISTTAQVIPVLWVVMVFQLGLFFPSERGYLSMESGEEHHKMPWLMAMFLAVTGLIMLIAEWTAIGALTDDSAPSETAKTLMEAGMWIGAFWVFALPTQPWVETVLDRTPIGRAKFWVWRKLGWKGEDPWQRAERREKQDDGND